MKFGGTSVADADGILRVREIVRKRRGRRPVVVVSALAGVTDLLGKAIRTAVRGDREALEPILAEVERKHRWALAGTLKDPTLRHRIGLEVDRLFEELRQLFRSLRILGEGTPRSSDALLAFGEILSGRIVTAAFTEGEIASEWVDPRDVMATDARHGAAQPDPERTGERCRRRLLPLLEEGKVPVVGGFVGRSPDGRTTTLGRGGSDTSAAVIGVALSAEEIQIWTDVDGLMTADPRVVPEAAALPMVTFAEAAELALYGARVLHPASIVSAVRRKIPVRIRNSLRPDGPGTEIVDDPGNSERGVVSVASRDGLRTIRVTAPSVRLDPRFVAEVMGALERRGLFPELTVASDVAVSVVVRSRGDLSGLQDRLGAGVRVEVQEGRALVCVVGSALAADREVRARILTALSALGPEIVAVGASGLSAAAVVPEGDLKEAVRKIHAGFLVVPEGRG